MRTLTQLSLAIGVPALIASSVIGAGLTLAPAHAEGVEVILSNHHVVLGTNLPSCPTEDSTPPNACSWNLNPGDGNGLGLSFVWTGAARIYVWPADPRHGAWRWVNASLRQTIRENYGITPSMSCMVNPKGDDWSIVRCANGHRYSINY